MITKIMLYNRLFFMAFLKVDNPKTCQFKNKIRTKSHENVNVRIEACGHWNGIFLSIMVNWYFYKNKKQKLK